MAGYFYYSTIPVSDILYERRTGMGPNRCWDLFFKMPLRAGLPQKNYNG